MSLQIYIQHLFRSWRHHTPLQMATVLVLSLVLVILSMVFGIRENLHRLNSMWGDNLELTLYLKDGVSNDAVNNFVGELKDGGKFSDVKYVGGEEALKRFTERMGSLSPDFVRSQEIENPLPASIELKLGDNSSAKEKIQTLRHLAGEYAHHALVDDVSYGQGWIENWAGFITSVHVMSGAAVALTVLLGLLVIGNSIRVSLSHRREEIEILELVGATKKWIRGPFILEGAMLGFLSSVIAGGVGYLLQMLLFRYLQSSLSFWNVIQEMHPLSIAGWVYVATIGTSFGALGAYVCVWHINSGWSAAERWNS